MDLITKILAQNAVSEKMMLESPICVVVADDGTKTAEGIGLTSWLESQNIPECFAIITDNVTSSDASYNLAELKVLQSKGHEIICHSKTSENLTDVSEANYYYYLNTAKNFMTANGFTDDIFVYPNGNNGGTKSTLITYVKKYFKYGLNVNIADDSTLITKGQWNKSAFATADKRLDIARCFMTADKPLTTSWVKTMYDNCIESNGLIIISVHDYGTDFINNILPIMKDTLLYLKENNVKFLTASEAFAKIEDTYIQKMADILL